MIAAFPIAAVLLAVFDEGDDLDELFQRAVLLGDKNVLLGQLDEPQKQRFFDRLSAWYSASMTLRDQRDRKRIVQIFTPIKVYEDSDYDVTVDRIPAILFEDDATNETFGWIINESHPQVRVILKSGVKGPWGTATVIPGTHAHSHDMLEISNDEGLQTLRIDDIEALIVL